MININLKVSQQVTFMELIHYRKVLNQIRELKYICTSSMMNVDSGANILLVR